MTLIGMADVLDALDFDPQGESTWIVGTDVEYAVYVEFGTSRNRAQPYLRPAVERAVRKLDSLDVGSPDEVAQKLALEIEREAKAEAPVDTGALRASISAEKID
jgi:phage gpG-like protein